MSMLRATLTAITIVAIVTAGQAAQAHGPECLGRHAGLGWGDGCHSRTARPSPGGTTCPTRAPSINGTYLSALRGTPACSLGFRRYGSDLPALG